MAVSGRLMSTLSNKRIIVGITGGIAAYKSAEIVRRLQDHGAEVLWIEHVKVATSPVYDIAQLAERDALTKIVVSNLHATQEPPIPLPSEILGR